MGILMMKNFKALYYDGLKQKMLGNEEDAMRFFRRCLGINPSAPSANFEVYQLLAQGKQPDSSLSYISKAATGDPRNIWYRYYYAQNLQELGRYKDVVKVYEDLTKMYPGKYGIILQTGAGAIAGREIQAGH